MNDSTQLISSAGRVLLVLADDRDSRLRDIAQALGMTERAVQNLLNELAEAGLIRVEKRGRRNRYLLQRRRMIETVGDRRISLGAWLDSWNPTEATEAVSKPEKAAAEPEDKPRKKPAAQKSSPETTPDSPQTQLDF